MTIKTANVKVNETFARQHLPMSPGSFIGLTVTDTGIGMDAETQSHVFEPFFTTKERGKGTGLGLATVYGVVKQSGGFIWVSSALGKGTTFEIFFPRVSESAKAIVQDTGASGTWRGSETVLLVEDDESLRNMVLNSLSEAGYMVLAAANGAEALRITRERSGNIDLLLTDVVMPGISGTRAADSIVALCPDVKVIYMSGYSDFAAGHDEILKEGRRFLKKPYKLNDLARAVREALDTNLVPALSLH